MTEHDKAIKAVKEYYGEAVSGARDLATKACTCGESIPPSHQAILAEIDSEILDRFYGCGSPIPPSLEGCTVLDLGCGAGRDAYLVSRLVGPRGRVIGVDMTAEQLAVARRHQAAQAERFGFEHSNIDFREGQFEDLAALGVADASIDVVISNCAINLSPRKERVFAEIFRVLKPGGELYFSDVFADRRPPPGLSEDPVLLGECLAGAMYIEDFRRMLRNLGCLDYRVVSRAATVIDNPAVEARVGGIGIPVDDCPRIQASRSRGHLRGLRAGGGLPRERPGAPAWLPPRRPPSVPNGQADARLRQHCRDGWRDAVRSPLPRDRRSLAAFRAIRLRHRTDDCAGARR